MCNLETSDKLHPLLQHLLWLCVATLSADLFLAPSSVCVIICNNTRQANGKVQRVPQPITHRPEKSCRLSSCGWQRFYLLCVQSRWQCLISFWTSFLTEVVSYSCVLIYLSLACVFLFAEVYSCFLCQSRETLITILHWCSLWNGPSLVCALPTRRLTRKLSLSFCLCSRFDAPLHKLRNISGQNIFTAQVHLNE